MPDDTAASTAAATDSATTNTTTATTANTAAATENKTLAGSGGATENAAATTTADVKTDTSKTDTAKADAAPDWRTGLDGEAKEFATRFSSIKDMAQAGVELRKANGSMVRVPGKDAKAEDVAKFRKAIGVPESADGYKPDIGRDLTDADKAAFTPIAKAALESGVPAEAFTKFSKAVAEMAKAQEAEANRVALAKREEAAASLKKDWGADYDANFELAKRALRTFAGNDADALLETTVNGQKLGDNPILIKAFGAVGRRMGEGEFIGAVGESERSTAQARIEQLMRENPPGTEKYKNPAVQKELSQLNEQLYGNAPANPGFNRVVL